MLLRSDGSTFTSSTALYFDALPGAMRRDAKVYVRIAVGTRGFTTMAMLDSGSSYAVLDADVAKRSTRLM